MKIHLVCLLQRTCNAMLRYFDQAEPKLHTLTDDPESADMILMVGRWSFYGETILNHPIPRLYPEKTFVYSDDDVFAPLLPGVYASASRGRFFSLNRMESQRFIDWLNPRVQPMQAEKRYLFSFAGRSSSLLRKRLFRINFRRSDVLIEDTSHYNHWIVEADREENQRRYAETLAASRFALCPKGASAGSYRLFEAMQMGIAPVILSDRYILPHGPDWNSFALFVPERKIGQLPQILAAREHEAEERGRLAAEAYRQWFAEPVVFNHIVALCQRIHARRRVPERWVQKFWPLMLWRLRLVRGLRGGARAAILQALQFIGKGNLLTSAAQVNGK
ncbi:MAG TPA: exostosin family protein [Edaphobacter sp.]